MEFRICWAASSNVTFRGHSDWEEWDDPEMTEEEIQESLDPRDMKLGDGLEMALDHSGFEWWVETR